jgi:hypothetical protein
VAGSEAVGARAELELEGAIGGEAAEGLGDVVGAAAAVDVGVVEAGVGAQVQHPR